MIYEEITVISDDGQTVSYIKGTDENGRIYGIPIDLANMDYQAYLASLE